MKNSIILFSVFVAFITLAFSGLYEHEQDLLGGTQLNGAGCVCHTVERDTSVTVWIEGPDTLIKGQTGLYRMYLANGPAEAGGHNVAGRFGIMSLVDTLSVWDYRSPNELTQAYPLEFPTPQDTIYWEFAYTAPDSVLIDTLYSCGLSLVYDHIPDFHDRWNFGPKFPVTVIDGIVPVELTKFIANVENGSVVLDWVTATETNNSGFEIERSKKIEERGEKWEAIGFVNGNGTTTETHLYSFKDEELISSNYLYRLKQIDFDGSFNYSNIVNVEILDLKTFSLSQNYPNPFNPATKISWYSPFSGWQTLKLYDILGNEVSVLVNEFRNAGRSEIVFNAADLPSGIYIYKLQAGDFAQSMKMLLLK
jgi:hypothetical protein